MTIRDMSQYRSSRSPKKADDAWELDDGLDYEPDKFYVGSRDREKESISVMTNIPRSLNSQIEAIIQSGKIPYYKTKQDFIRDAVYHRFYFVKNHLDDPKLERLLAAVLATAAAERRMREVEEYEDAITAFEAAFEAALKAGHDVVFAETLNEAEKTLSSWPMCGAKERLAALVDRYRRMVDDK